jgi:peptidoglycan/LPS O-acetylase OafA/YrhL
MANSPPASASVLSGGLTHPKYRPDIDGLRAIAVLSVIVFHAFPGALRGGFVGVDVFFIISGFLISSILFENLERESFSFLEFYRRRVARIFPALLTVLGSCLAFGALVLMANEYQALAKHVLGGAGFVSNYVLWGESGYFDSAAETKPLLHLWSLGIEEQYYLLWPAIVYGAWRLRWNLFIVTAALLLISFLLNIFTVERDPIAAFYSPQTRVWELLLGACLAYASVFRAQSLRLAAVRWGTLASLMGAALIGAALLLTSNSRAFPGWWALLPTGGTVLLIAAGPGGWLNRRILGTKPLVWVGGISFPLYLWHWPLLVFAHILCGAAPPPWVRLLMIGAALVLAWATCRWVEKPLRFDRSNRRIALLLVLGMSALGALAAGCFVSGGWPTRDIAEQTAQFSQVKQDSSYTTPTFDRGIIDGPVLQGQRGERVLFIGDSLMSQYYPRIAQLYADPRHLPVYSSEFVARPGCRPVPHGAGINKKALHCDEYYQALIALARRPIYTAIVISASWELIFSPSAVAANQGPLTEDLRALTALGKRLTFIAVAPHGAQFEPLYLARPFRLHALGLAPPAPLDASQARAAAPQDHDGLRGLTALAHELGAMLIDPADTLCSAMRCATLVGGRPLHLDDYHLRDETARERATFLDSLLSPSL